MSDHIFYEAEVPHELAARNERRHRNDAVMRIRMRAVKRRKRHVKIAYHKKPAPLCNIENILAAHDDRRTPINTPVKACEKHIDILHVIARYLGMRRKDDEM
jgi:hypothetical protein